MAATNRTNTFFVTLSFVVLKLRMLIYRLVNSASSLQYVALRAENKVFVNLSNIRLSWLFLVLAVFSAGHVSAATLPEDNIDVLYHQYDGGGMEISGPSVLIRKNIGPQVSLSGHYYVDSVSAASVDVLATASEYEEERIEQSIGIDYLHEKTILSVGFANSSENDYEADTIFFGVSQDFFGGLSTLSFGYARGSDEFGAVGGPLDRSLDRHNFKLGLSQVLTKTTLAGINLEVIADEGDLENPYRQNRFINPANNAEFLYQAEQYPETRTSTALALRLQQYLPYRASIKGEYRYFYDTWGINAHTLEAKYVHALGNHWILEGKLRYYTQDQSDFYSDLYAFEASQNHLARDKEMSTFSSSSIGAGVSYEFKQGVVPGIKRFQFSLLFDYMQFDYENFRDVTASGTFLPGEEPLYEFDAWVTRASIIVEY